MFDGDPTSLSSPGQRPRATVQVILSNLTETATAASTLLLHTGKFYRVGDSLVEITFGDHCKKPSLRSVTVHHVINAVHFHCDVVRANRKGEETPDQFPKDAAHLLLAMADRFPELRGLSSGPKLREGGGIEILDGYDEESGLFYYDVPRVRVPRHATRRDAEQALALLRRLLMTFCFADAVRGADGKVEQAEPPGFDETSALVAIVTAVSRPFLDFAPGLVVTAPALNGSGAGKGLLVRLVCLIAYGTMPTTINASPKPGEFDNRIAAALMKATQALLVDNVNGLVPASDLLASIFTEPEVEWRVLGLSKLVRLLTVACIFITGNATTLQEDQLRRNYTSHLDPQVEDAEAREFPPGLLDDVRRRRADYLAAVLTIWRWAQQNPDDQVRGLALGTFDRWCRWCRDPILTLGGADPVAKARAAKQDDPRRSEWAETLRLMRELHGSGPVTLPNLHPEVMARLTTPSQKSPQYIRRRLEEKVGTRAGGLVLHREKTSSPHSQAKYSVHETGEHPPLPPPVSAREAEARRRALQTRDED